MRSTFVHSKIPSQHFRGEKGTECKNVFRQNMFRDLLCASRTGQIYFQGSGTGARMHRRSDRLLELNSMLGR